MLKKLLYTLDCIIWYAIWSRLHALWCYYYNTKLGWQLPHNYSLPRTWQQHIFNRIKCLC